MARKRYVNRWFPVTALLAVASAAYAGNNDITLTHYEVLERVSVQSPSVGGISKPNTLESVVLSFDAFGDSFIIQLQPNARLLAAMPASFRESSGIPYQGGIEGVESSWARVVIKNGQPAGLIFDGQALFALELPGDSLVPVTSPIAYRLADVLIAPGALSCAAGATATDAASVFTSMSKSLGSVVSQGPGAIDELSVGVVTDQYFTASKTDPQSAILNRFNIVDGFYSQQLGVQITPYVDTFTVVDDPFSPNTVTDAETLLNEVNTFRSGNSTQLGYGLTHLYTGRDLDGTTAGLAWIDTLCRSNVGTGLSEGRSSPTIDALVTAHEIGHNFGAPHDGDPNEACAAEPPNQYIMATTVNANFTGFSDCSVSIMEAAAAAASCITALPATDISVRFNEPSSTLFLSNIARNTVDVVNNGTEVAQDVSVQITLPAPVSYVDAAGGAASCTHVAGVVTCTLGDVAGNGLTTIALTTDTVSVGSGSFDAVVTALDDDRPGNNFDTVQLTVDPAVDLVIQAPAAASQIEVNQSTTIAASIDNISTMDATSVTLSVSLQAGLEASTATWSLGTCTVAAQQVDCQASQFDRQSGSTFSLSATGTVKGNKTFTFTLASTEDDAHPTDNSYAGTVRVGSPGGNDEGGGALGWLSLLFLAALGLGRAINRSPAAPAV